MMKRASCFLLLLMPAVTQAATDIKIDPFASLVLLGDTVEVSINVESVVDLYAYQFDIQFDPTILSALSIDEGPFLSTGGATLFLPGAIDNTEGNITFTAETLLGGVAGVTGSGTLARLRFEALAFGSSGIQASNVVLVDSASADIVSGAGVTVPEIPEPNTALIFAGAIGLGLLRRRIARIGATQARIP